MADLDTRKTPAAWMRNLLLGSAALNVFLIGFLFAKVLGPEVEPGQKAPTTVTLGALPPDLPQELREEFENNFKAHQGEVEKKYRDLFQTRIKVKDLMEAANLDEKALKESLKKVRLLQDDIQGSIHDTMVETLRDMDPDTRRIFVFGGDPGLEKGIWTQRQFDGARWKVEFENGQIVIDFQGITKDKGTQDEDAPGGN